LTVASGKLSSTLQRFERYLLTERRDPDTGLTPAERYKKELGQELSMPDLPALPAPFASAGEITILCDDFDGIVLLPDYTRFRRVFETEEPDRHVPDWKELVWSYVKDPDIPTVAFERVAEQAPQRVEKVLRSLIGDKDFSIEHLYAVLLHYKQPVDGLEDLKDDQDLWDLFNGNSSPAKAAPAPSKKRNKAGTKKARPSKASVKSKARPVAKKTSPAAHASTSKRERAAKLARKSSAKSKAAKKSTRKHTSKVR
ncbi:MAG TPA: hypothetical protein VFB82_10125, partial [Blastocatellia bacterium]|nr:hypothetical protein [Blastocatellia bacterium]